MEKRKERIDQLLVKKGLTPTRERAQAAIMAGVVYANGNRIDKPGMNIVQDADIVVETDPVPYVSRGGLKLEKAICAFNVDLRGKVMADVGASTGGFTDCALQHGAIKVFAIDVGYGQLAWQLRQDPRVVCMERTNVRYLRVEDIGELLDVVTIDVAFISLDKVLPVIKGWLKPNGQVIALIKPQFEAGREKVGKHGVVKDPAVHHEVIEYILNTSKKIGFHVLNLSYSPITGPKGNIEYLCRLGQEITDAADYSIDQTVADAQQSFVTK